MNRPSSLNWLVVCLYLLAVVLLLGAVSVMVGWQTGNRTLIQIAPGFAPMQFNTALGFLFSGLAALGCARRWWGGVGIGAAGMMFLGGSSLLQYLLGISLGLDELFTRGYVLDRTSVAGRMSEPTALGFLVCGVAYGLLLLARNRGQWWRLPVLLAGSLAAMVTGASLLGYATGFRSIGGWLNLYGMAVHTCIGFVLSTLAIFFAESELLVPEQEADAMPARALLVAVLVGGMAITTYGAGVATRVEDRIIQQQLASELRSVADRVERSLQMMARLLDGAVGLFAASDRVDRDEWRKYVMALRYGSGATPFAAMGAVRYLAAGELADYEQHVVDEGFSEFSVYPVSSAAAHAPVHFIEPFDLLNQGLFGYDLYTDAVHEAAMQRAALGGTIAMTADHQLFLQTDFRGESDFSLYRALYDSERPLRSEQERIQALRGWVFVTFHASDVFDDVMAKTEARLLLRATDLTGMEFALYQDAGFDENQAGLRDQVRFGGRLWQLSAQRDPAVPETRPLTATLIFLAGSGITLAAGFAVLFFAFARQRAEQLARRMTESLRQSEQLMRQNEEHYSLALRGSRDGYWDWDVDSGKLFCSPGMCAMLGLDDFKEAQGLDAFLAPHCNSADLARLRVALQGVMDAATANLDVEMQMLDAQSEERWFQLRGRKVEDRSGDGLRLAGSLSNIHDRKLVELEMQSRNVHLDHVNRELTQLSFVTAHNLKEPVRKISICSSKVRRGLEQSHADQAQLQSLDKLDRCTNKMADLLDDLQAYSQVISDELQYERVDPEKLFRPVLVNLARRFTAEDYALTIGDLPSMRADVGMLRRALEELIGNAVRYRKPGERAMVQVAYGGLVTHAGGSGMYHRIEVRDNGIGVDKQYVDRLFNLFERLKSGDEAGTGLGLALVRKIVERHKGYVGLDSVEGEGTVAWLELPE